MSVYQPACLLPRFYTSNGCTTVFQLYAVPLYRSQIDGKWVLIPEGKDLLIQPVLLRLCELHIKVVDDFGKDEPHFGVCQAVIRGFNLSVHEQER